MSSTGNSWQRSLQAAESAGRLLAELNVDVTRQIDVFSMCEDLGLWLTFVPMDGLLGAFVPEGVGGVLVTDRRPITVQRYTAAHELGHWRLEHGHGLALDGDEHVFGASLDERERLAQVFAAALLMPPPLILSLLARIGIDDREAIGAREVYFVAREAGVSFEAAIRQLHNLDLVSAPTANALLDVRPLNVKRELAGGRRPLDGYADVWPVDEAWDDHLLSLRANDEVVISLPENRSTGYRWMFDDDITAFPPTSEPPPFADSGPGRTSEEGDIATFLASAGSSERGRAPGAALERIRRHPQAATESDPGDQTLPGGIAIVGDDYLPGRTAPLRARDARRARLALASGHGDGGGSEDTSQIAGPDEEHDPDPVIAATGRRLLGVRFTESGPKTLRLQRRNPYDTGEPSEHYVLHAVVEPRRRGISIDQLVDDLDEPWVDEVRERQLRAPTAELTEDAGPQ